MKKSLIIFLLIPNFAFAQQQLSTKERVMGERILQELNENLSCKSEKITMEVEIAKLQARIKELETEKDKK